MTDTIGGRIEAALVEKNMTRKELVEKSGVNKMSLSKYIRNENVPNISRMSIIAEALDVTVSWLSGFEQNDFCNLYKKEETYELYEICACEFHVYELNNEIILARQNETPKYYENNNKNLEFGKKIKETLDYFDMMIKDLAEKIAVNPKQVSDYIHDRRSPSLPTIEAFAEALKVSPSWLAGFIDIDIRNTYVMRDNPEETIYLHPFQYVITKIEDNGNKITLKKIQKE